MMKRDQIEFRYVQRKSMRAFHVWAVRACIFNTPAAGPMILLRLFGWSLHIYPWMHSQAQGGGK